MRACAIRRSGSVQSSCARHLRSIATAWSCDHWRVSAQLSRADDATTGEALLWGLRDVVEEAAELRPVPQVDVPDPAGQGGEFLRRNRRPSALHVSHEAQLVPRKAPEHGRPILSAEAATTFRIEMTE